MFDDESYPSDGSPERRDVLFRTIPEGTLKIHADEEFFRRVCREGGQK